jgi:hypothetical protein
VARGQVDLYAGDPESAWQAVETAWPMLTASHLTRIQSVRVESNFLRARAAVGCAASASPARRASLLVEARRLARRLDKERVGWASAHADHIRAGAAQVEGDAAAAPVALERAEHGYAGCDMQLFAAATQYRRARTPRSRPAVTTTRRARSRTSSSAARREDAASPSPAGEGCWRHVASVAIVAEP